MVRKIIPILLALLLGGCAEAGMFTLGMVVGPAIGLAFRMAGSSVEAIVPNAGQLCLQKDGFLGIIVKESLFRGECMPVRVLTVPEPQPPVLEIEVYPEPPKTWL